MNHIDLNTAAWRLLDAPAVLFLCHSHPDGDTLGSAYALALALQTLGKPVCVLCGDPSPAMFDFMAEGLTEPGEDSMPDAGALVVSVDVADETLLGSVLEGKYRGKIGLNIDHHSSNLMFAAENLVDPEAAACSEIAGDLVDAMGVPMTAQMAACIYAGISTDTGCFRYTNTTARSHLWAARCMELDVETEPLDRAFFETESKTYLALERMAFDSLRYYFDGRAAVMAVTREMFRQSGSNEEEYIKIVARVRNIEGVLVGAVIREKEHGGYKISMRSHAPVDVSALCGRMGGGGHPRAAGASSKLPLEETIKLVVGYMEEALP